MMPFEKVVLGWTRMISSAPILSDAYGWIVSQVAAVCGGV